jgi:hypothetical protein
MSLGACALPAKAPTGEMPSELAICKQTAHIVSYTFVVSTKRIEKRKKRTDIENDYSHSVFFLPILFPLFTAVMVFIIRDKFSGYTTV